MTKNHAIKTAAKWWAAKLKRRQPHSNGDNSIHSMLACMLADVHADKITDEQLALFTVELEAEIHKFMEKYNDLLTFLGCDYAPCEMISNAANTANIGVLNFPFKTHMCIERNGDNYTVKVADGYGVGYEEVQPCELEVVDDG